MSVFIQNTDILDPSLLLQRANQYWYTADTRFAVRALSEDGGDLTVHVAAVRNAMRDGQYLTIFSIAFGKAPSGGYEEILDQYFSRFPRIADLFTSLLRLPWNHREEANTFDPIHALPGVTVHRSTIRAEYFWSPFVRLPALAEIPATWNAAALEQVLSNGQFSTLEAKVLVGGRDQQERVTQFTGPEVARMLREECNFRIEGDGREVSIQFSWPNGTTLTTTLVVDYV